MIPDQQFTAALREVLQLKTGCYLGFGLDHVLIGEQEDGDYWVMESDCDENGKNSKVVFHKASLKLDEAIELFLEIRKRREWGFDIEDDLNKAADEGSTT